MLYLEDYLEMIENLPMEMRDKFTEMREMDLQVSNATDSLEEKVNQFFKKCGSIPNLKQDWKDDQMAKIRQEYAKALEDADEKVQLATQIYELVERHLRKLDQEVSKFKMELEADNAGITEILERRANEMDKVTPQLLHNNHGQKAEKRKYSLMVQNSNSNSLSSFNNHIGNSSKLKHQTSLSSFLDFRNQSSNLAAELNKDTPQIYNNNINNNININNNMNFNAISNNVSNSSLVSSSQNIGGLIINNNNTVYKSLMPNSRTNSPPLLPPLAIYEQQNKVAGLTYNLGQAGTGSNAAIAVAASRAIGATLEMQQGRRTASLKASYEAVSKNVDLSKELTLGRENSNSLGGSNSNNSNNSSNKSNANVNNQLSSITNQGSLEGGSVKSSSRNKKYANQLKISTSSSFSNSSQHLQQQLLLQNNSSTAISNEVLLKNTNNTSSGIVDQSTTATSLSSDSLAIGGGVTEEVSSSGWQADPNEPRYCLCNDVSYGDMVGCDNDDCPLEWFHYGCVGLQQAPRGKWYCPQCQTNMKRRGRK